MPIDIFKGEYYSFKFEQFIKYICTLFSNKYIKEYFTRWINILNELNCISILEYHQHMNTRADYEKNNRRYEMFTHEVYLNNSYIPYIFHYDIEQILSRIPQKKYNKMKTKELIEITRYDNSELLTKQQIKKSPIIIVPFADVDSYYLVIDGNKRLTYRVKKRKRITKYILLNDINKSDFILSCDWAMYFLYCEINKCLGFKKNFGESKVIEYLNSEGILNQQKFISDYEKTLKNESSDFSHNKYQPY